MLRYVHKKCNRHNVLVANTTNSMPCSLQMVKKIDLNAYYYKAYFTRHINVSIFLNNWLHHLCRYISLVVYIATAAKLNLVEQAS